MPTKVYISQQLMGLKDPKITYLDDTVIEVVSQEPREVLEYFIKENIPLGSYKDVRFDQISKQFTPQGKYEGFIKIDETTADNSSSIQDLVFNHERSQVYDQAWFEKLIASKLVFHDLDSRVMRSREKAKLYDGIAENDIRLPSFVEIGQVLFGADFTQSDLRTYAPILKKEQKVDKWNFVY